MDVDGTKNQIWGSDDEEFEASILEFDDLDEPITPVKPLAPTPTTAQELMRKPVTDSLSSVNVSYLRKPTNCSTPLPCKGNRNKAGFVDSDCASLAALISNRRSVLSDSTNTISRNGSGISTPNNPHRRKRKFPGPAGTLPKLTKDIDLKQLKEVPAIPEEEPISETITPSQCSQAHCVSDNLAWKRLVHELEIPMAHLSNHCIKNALLNAAKKRLPDGKVPLLVVVIDAIEKSTPSATVVLRDLTGMMQGLLHSLIVKQHNDKLKIGSALLLKQAAVFCPKPRKRYLNITPNNLLQIYCENEQTTDIEKTIVTGMDAPLEALLSAPVALAEPSAVTTRCTVTQLNSPVQSVSTRLFTAPDSLSKRVATSSSNQPQAAGPKESRLNTGEKLNGRYIHNRSSHVDTPTTNKQSRYDHESNKPTAGCGRLSNQIQANTLVAANQTNVAMSSTDAIFSDDDDFGDLDLDI